MFRFCQCGKIKLEVAFVFILASMSWNSKNQTNQFQDKLFLLGLFLQRASVSLVRVEGSLGVFRKVLETYFHLRPQPQPFLADLTAPRGKLSGAICLEEASGGPRWIDFCIWKMAALEDPW